MTYAPASRYRAGLMQTRHAQLVETTMIWSGTSTGSANAQVIAPEFTADLKAHPTYVFVAGYTNTGATTLSADGGTTNVSLRKPDGTALSGGEIVAGNAYTVVLDSTPYWRLISGAASVPSFLSTGLKSGAYSVATTDAGKLIPCTGTWQLSLPAAATAGNGFTLAIYNAGSGIITIKPSGSETIAASGAVTLGAGGNLIIICDGTSAWYPFGTVTSSTALDPANKGSSVTLSNSNLTATNSTATWSCVRATTAIFAGKWYFECRQDVLSSPTRVIFGLAASSVSMADGNNLGAANCWSLSDNGQLSVNGSGTSSWSSAWGAAGSVVGMYVDATTLSSIKIWFALNGVMIASGDPATGANPAATITGSPTLYPAVSLINSAQVSIKFSKSSWQYTPVTGYNSLP